MARRHTISRNKKRWSDLTPTQRVSIILAGAVQLTLLVAALTDVRRRPESEINGGKRLWTALSFVNFIGPIAYFVFGRKRPVTETAMRPPA
ncbi:MAG: hypothetical protein JWO42_1582 [Chloroflexi bacterium]|nr:hypothetical protein [Chloroflexota bacterium]